MPDDIRPTVEDLARDLRADLEKLDRLSRAVPEWVGGTMREPDLAIFAREFGEAAIRRALAAEAEVARLRVEIADVERLKSMNESAVLEAFKDTPAVADDTDDVRLWRWCPVEIRARIDAEVAARAAGKDALGRLEAWRLAAPGIRDVVILPSIATRERIGCHLRELTSDLRAVERAATGWGGTLAECIEAALTDWARSYPEATP